MNQLVQKAMPQMQSQMQPPAQPQMPQQGAAMPPTNQLSAAAQPTMAQQVQNPPQAQTSDAYNGTVNVNGNPVQVKDGIAEMGGKRYFVAIDGSVVMNEQRQVVGKVVNGKFEPTDEAHISELRKKGIVE